MPNQTKYIAVYSSKGTLKNSDKYLVPENHFFVLGDNFFENNPIKNFDFKDFHEGACIFTTQVNNPEEFGVASIGQDQKVIEIIEMNTGKKADISFEKRAYKDVDIVLPNLNKSNNILNWKPTTNIKDGIMNTVNWYLANQEKLKDIKFKYDYEK